MPEYVKAKRADPDNPLKARANKLGLVMIDGEIIPSTRRAHEAAEFGRAQGKLEKIHEALLQRYWSRSQDLYAMETLRGAAADAGLDPDELQAAIESGQYTPIVEAKVAEAQQMGVRAVPTFLIADKYVAQGALEAETFRKAFHQMGLK